MEVCKDKEDRGYEEKFYLVFELCRGGELFTHLATHHPLDEHTVRSVIHQLLHVLHHIHSQGYIHRDVKLENILFKHS